MDGIEFQNGSPEIGHILKGLPTRSALITDLRLPSLANLGFNAQASWFSFISVLSCDAI